MSQTSSPYQPSPASSEERTRDNGSDNDSADSVSESNLPNNGALRVKFDKPSIEAYLALYNAGARGNELDTRPLASSVIGSTSWSSSEKEMLFRSLAYHGKHNPLAIAHDVPSKSTLEVQQYLTALKDGADQLGDDETGQTLRNTPAATELSHQLESALEGLSTLIEANLHDQLCAADQTRYGDLWIIDADMIDDETSSESGQESDAELEEALSSFSLLRPAAFLQLMRHVFMNSNTGPRWDNLEIRTRGSEGPSMLRSAFEDFYQLAMSMTRRLVQAVLLQTLSRLRADHGPRILPTVRASDVRTALNMLDIKPRLGPSFWLRAVKDLTILSRSKGLKDESASMPRRGYPLPRLEVERLLGTQGQLKPDRRNLDDESVSHDRPPGHDRVDDTQSNASDDTEDTQDAVSGASITTPEERRHTIAEKHDDRQSFKDENAIRSNLNLPLVGKKRTLVMLPSPNRPVKRQKTAGSTDTERSSVSDDA